MPSELWIKKVSKPRCGADRIQYRLGLNRFFAEHFPKGREEISWATMAKVLVLCRLCHPSSELHMAEHFLSYLTSHGFQGGKACKNASEQNAAQA
jgi:hypothetical protein